MTLQVSSGFTRLILGAHSFSSIFDGGAIAIYTGAQPENANHPATGTLLGYVSSTGLAWNPGSSVNGLSYLLADTFVLFPPASVAAITPIATGVAGWFRVLPTAGDDPAYSVLRPRIDGAINSTGVNAELRLLNPSLVTGEVRTIDSFVYTIPPLPGD